ncbi:MAG TPA: thiamine pyrophosphate-binding protein [Dehalococcoidia bacterium]|nr:thiamine pyrophosphate-binding protein [Dehalococcoidia bacterium]
MSGARYIADTLKGYGVTHVFFVPAILHEGLMEMERQGIKRILTHSEKAAAYMADGYARASHKPGICLAQSVGAANLAAGLQDAYLGLSPVIAITGRRRSVYRYRHAYQEIEHKPMFDAVTKFNVTVDTVEQLPLLLRQAFREAVSGPPGPAHLEFQGIRGEIIMEQGADLEVIVEEQFSHYPAFRPAPEPELVLEAVKVLCQSQRPIIVAGGGVKASQAGAELVELAERLSIPVVTSLNGKGTIRDDHPLAIGVAGSYSAQCANRAVAEADLVLFVGSRTGSQVTNDWEIPRSGTPVMQIDIDPSELGRNYPAKVGISGDAKVTLRRLIEATEPVAPRTDWLRRINQLKEEWQEQIKENYNSSSMPIRPERLCREITHSLPEDALLLSDTGHSAIWTGTMVDLKHAGQTYIRCAGSLGWALPAALGAKCAFPDRPVICFTGDGGFWYHLAELETARRYGINVLVIVNNNGSMNQVKKGAERVYAGRNGRSDDIWQFTDVDFSRVAEAMGCYGIRVTDPAELKAALHKGLAADRPTVIDVVSDIEGIPPPVWT